MSSLRPLPGPIPLPLDASRGRGAQAPSPHRPEPDAFDDVLDNALTTAGEVDREAQQAGAGNEPRDRDDNGTTLPQTTAAPIARAGEVPAIQTAPRDDETTTTSTTTVTTTTREPSSPASPGPAAAARLGEALQQAVTPKAAASHPTHVKGRPRTHSMMTVAPAAIGQATERRHAQGPTPSLPPVVDVAAPRISRLEPVPDSTPAREAGEAALTPRVPQHVDDAGEEHEATDTGRPIPAIVDAGRAEFGATKATAPRSEFAPPAALEHLEALLHDPASGVLLDGRAAVVTVDGLKVRIVTDHQGHTSVRMVAVDAALGAALEHQAASLSAGLQGAGLHLEQLQVSREAPPDGASDHQRRPHPPEDDDAPVPSRRRSTALPTTPLPHGGVLVVRA